MNSDMLHLVAFGAGVVIGSFATWMLVKSKYEQIAQEEINSVKETFLDKENKMIEEMHITKENFEKQQNDILKHLGYKDHSKDEDYEEESEETNKMNSYGPVVVPPEEYGDYEDYELISLTYYADGVLTDEDDDPVEDIEEKVGDDFMDHFGEYEDDSVFIRNDDLRCYFEILADERKYSDVMSQKLGNISEYRDSL